MLLLGLRAGAFDTARHDQMRVEDARGRHPDFTYPRDNPCVGGGAQTQAAILLRDRGAKQSQLFHLFDQVNRVLVRLIELARDRAQLLFDPFVDGGQHLLFDRRVVAHAVSPEKRA